MSEIDYRYPYPFWIGTGKRAKVYYSRIASPNWSNSSKDLLIASCINSIELLLTWQAGQERIVWLLYRAMGLKGCGSFDSTPGWMRLSGLTRPTLAEFKRLLIKEIEMRLIIQIDPDLEDSNG